MNLDDLSFEGLYELMGRIEREHFGDNMVDHEVRMAVPEYAAVWTEIMHRRYPPGYECNPDGLGHTGANET